MRPFVTVLLLTLPLAAQDDPRLSIHTLVREDIFAGWMANDMARMERGEAKAKELIAARPQEKAVGQIWLVGGQLHRATLAREKGDMAAYAKHYAAAMELATEAWKSNDGGVAAVTGGIGVVFADKLAEKDRAFWWPKAYESFKRLETEQMGGIARFPVHMKGELLAGLAMGAQRTGRTDEVTKYLGLMEQHLAGSSYENLVKKWRENPEVAAKTNLGCKTCHDPGRLEPSKARLTARGVQTPQGLAVGVK